MECIEIIINHLIYDIKSNQYNQQFIKLKFFKLFLFLIIIFFHFYINNNSKLNKLKLNKNYLNIQLNLNLTFQNTLKNKIKIGIYAYGLTNGGIARSTSLFLNNIYEIKIFDIFLFTQKKKEYNEYLIPKNIKRIVIKNAETENLIFTIQKMKIDILIYQFPNYNEINILNKLENIKIIYYQHSCSLYWIYYNYFSFKLLYKEYKNSKYIISLIPFENDYLFKKWGINSILMNNFINYDYNSISPSNLTSKCILMIGRSIDRMKRYELGILAMKDIIKDIPECEMKIISSLDYIDYLKDIVKNLNLENNIKFEGYTSTPEIYFKNASLHIFPTISESFGYVLSETKIYGIPSILVGLDYVSISKGGTVIIYDDKPQTIANEAIKILKNDDYRKKLGNEARESMKQFDNKLLLKRWIKLILSIFNGDNYYQKLRYQDKKISENESLIILKNQIELLKIRRTEFINFTINELVNFTFMENFQ